MVCGVYWDAMCCVMRCDVMYGVMCGVVCAYGGYWFGGTVWLGSYEGF